MTLRTVCGILAALMLIAGPALAQRTPVFQSGITTPNAPAKFDTNGPITSDTELQGDAKSAASAHSKLPTAKILGCVSTARTWEACVMRFACSMSITATPSSRWTAMMDYQATH